KYLKRAGLNPKGVLYKMYNNLSQTRTHRTQGVEKKNRKTEPNNDLGVLLGGIHRTGPRLRNYLYDNLDIPKIVNFLAANSVVSNTDLHAKNYYLYRDTTGTREWCFLPWDLDLSWGRQWNSSDTYFDDSIFVDRTILAGRGNFLVRVLTDIPEIRAMVLRRIRSLSDQYLQSSNTPLDQRHFERRILELQELIDPQDTNPSDADLDFSKWRIWGNRNNMAAGVRRLLQEYLPGRRNFVFNRQATGRGGEIPTAQNPLSVIRIGEIDFNPESGNQEEEYLELRNPNAVAVDLSDWTLSSAVDFTLKPGTVLPARGKIFISPDVNAFRGRGRSPKANEANFIQGGYKGHLSARGETVELRNAEGNLIDSLTYIGTPSPLQQYLRITEVLYAPPPPTEGELLQNPNAVASDFEFIEFTNIGPEPLNLSGAAIIDGIEFIFSPESQLGSGDSTVIVSNLAIFKARYGTGMTLSGEFSGKLNNSGEQIRLQDASGESVLQFTYEENWHELAAQSGHSLVILDPETEFNRWSEQVRWGISLSAGGSPGDIQSKKGLNFDGWKKQFFTEEEQGDSDISSSLSDIDHDGLPNLLEYAYGLDPKSPDSEAILTAAIVQQDGDLFLDITYRRQKHPLDLSYTLEFSENLSDWATVQISIVETNDNPDGTERVTFRSNLNRESYQHRFIRLKVQRTP
ncbi:MAG TPA: hypothetical protein EYG38_06055, partial [Verrucomicrobia bacterium]|nr:hypothetical protein [Verrucomicrobiota bacterium]